MKLFYKIKENTLIAQFAAYNLNKDRCAIVINKTIYLWGITKADFLNDEKYLNHELHHIFQYHQLGLINFLVAYSWESFKKGYYNNKFEVEAREAETKERSAEFILLGNG